MGAGRAASDAATANRARGAIVVLPTTAAGQQGPVAALVSAAGWASGLRRLLGHVWIVTPDGVVASDDLRGRASAPTLAPAPERGWRQRVPVVAKTAVKDAREWQRARRFHVDPAGPWRGYDVACVWQRHELFHQAGPRLARELRGSGLRVDVYPEADKLAKQFKYASARNAPFVAILGDDERARGEVGLKDLRSGEQASVRRSELGATIRSRLQQTDGGC